MNYFFQLLGALDLGEIAAIESARLTPTERKIFHFLRDSRNDDDPADEAVSALEISHNTYYKNCSNLLSKSYEALVPEGGLALLFFLLKKKFLVANGMRELAKQERTMVRKMTPKEKESYYFAVFHLLRSVEKIEIPMPEFRKYGKKLLASRLKPHPDDELAIDIYLKQRQFTKDVKQTAKRLSKQYTERYKKSLDKHAERLKKSKNAFAHYNYHSAVYNYCYNTHADPGCMKEHLDEILKWMPKELEEVFPWVRQARKLDEGTIHVLQGEYEKGFEFYQKHFSDETAEYVTLRVPMDYFMSALYTDRHEVAEKLIQKIHKKDLEKPLENSRTSVLAAIWLAILYMNWEKFDKAIFFLNNASRWNKKGSYSRYNESIIRALEICYHFLNKDWDFTEQLITRNRQWLRRNEFKDPVSPEVAFNDITKNYLGFIFDGKPFSEELETRKKEIFRTEVSGLIGKFLDKMKVIAESSKY